MSKLIGTDPNQVPSNADLGSAAFMDKKEFLLSKGSDISAIDAVIPKTAVDVFIYDTSKDSDAGAWRKRTQHTSWYNERLNTTTRGSRKEFPAVAVIVAESNQVTIYDGDYPSMPMWMIFNTTSGNMMGGSTSLNAVEMLNSNLVVGATGYAMQIDFIKDYGLDWFTNQLYEYKGNIEQRNDTLGFTLIESYGIINSTVNDVAMTVLPNAPIDTDTGLPTPTIALACDSIGTSIITESGQVFDITSNDNIEKSWHVAFTHDYKLAVQNYDDDRGWRIMNIPTSDLVLGNHYTRGGDFVLEWYNGYVGTGTQVGDLTTNGANQNPNSSSFYLGLVDTVSHLAIGHAVFGVSLIARNTSSPENGMSAFVESNYNTGWMPGDIKLATLSDTDAADVTGSELVTNGTFDSNITGWTASNSQAQVVHDTGGDGGRLKFTANGANNARIRGTLTTALVSGKTYTLSYNAQSTVPSKTLRLFLNTVDSISGGQTLQNTDTTDVGDGVVNYSYTFTATGNWTYILLETNGYGFGSNYIWYIDDVSVRIAEEDRSVNGNGLQVFGTVTKNPVATGADLVAYSGFSTSNYLEQPYNADMEIFRSGSSSFALMGWVKKNGSTSGADIFWSTGNPGTAGQARNLAAVVDGTLAFYGWTSTYDTYTSSTISDNIWYHFCFTYENGVNTWYLNGKYNNSKTVTLLSYSNNPVMKIGDVITDNATTRPGNVSLSLFRVSATVPTADKIKKMYEDEKFLFQDNAQATLYGTSDAVTALAYDDSTHLLHVGTSAGRSVFQGLRRIDNTTDAVGAAISASNGMVAED